MKLSGEYLRRQAPYQPTEYDGDPQPEPFVYERRAFPWLTFTGWALAVVFASAFIGLAIP